METVVWLNDQTLKVSSSSYIGVGDQRRASRVRKRLKRAEKKYLANVMWQLLMLWPTRTDEPNRAQRGREITVTVTLALPLARAFADRVALAKHGYVVGVAAVPEALAINQEEARAAIRNRYDPIAIVRCLHADGTAMVAILEVIGCQFAPERRVLRAVRNIHKAVG